MRELALSVGEPFTSPAWGSNFVVFATETGRPIAPEDTKDYLRKCCQYAKRFEVHLVPERFVLMDYECMCLVSPSGKVLGAQRGLHLNPRLRTHSKRGSAVETFNTEFGCIFLCVDVDIYHPEVARVAAAMGAQIIVCSQQIARGDYSSHMVLSGAWNAAQLSRVFVISVCNQYNALSAPRPLTPQDDGFVVPPNLKLPMTAKLNADALHQVEAPHPLSRKLYALHRPELIR